MTRVTHSVATPPSAPPFTQASGCYHLPAASLFLKIKVCEELVSILTRNERRICGLKEESSGGCGVR